MQHAPGFLHLVEDALTRVSEVPAAEVAQRLEAGERFELIDVREHEEWTRGHLPRARHLCKGIIERDIEAVVPDRDAPIVLYCGGGYRSALAADALQKMGYRRVASMAGGWRGWTEAGLPVDTER
jgi:rhodanese-related sulfurtransferase